MRECVSAACVGGCECVRACVRARACEVVCVRYVCIRMCSRVSARVKLCVVVVVHLYKTKVGLAWPMSFSRVASLWNLRTSACLGPTTARPGAYVRGAIVCFFMHWNVVNRLFDKTIYAACIAVYRIQTLQMPFVRCSQQNKKCRGPQVNQSTNRAQNTKLAANSCEHELQSKSVNSITLISI